MNVYAEPGVLTTVQDPAPMTLRMLAAFGVRWISYQAQNGGNDPADFDLEPARAAGLSPGVWGVTYGRGHTPDAEIFLRDGRTLGSQAVKLGAEHLMVDVEYAAKGTRDGRLLRPIVDGVRAGGWSGPVHVTTLGAPRGPYGLGANDYEIDIESFLETGGGMFSQDYAHATQSYAPKHGKAYWTAMGVPPARYSSMIGFHVAEGDQDTPGVRWTGAQWRPLLEEADVGRAVSIFMAEFTTEADLAALEPLFKTSAPPSGPAAAETEQRIVDLAGAQIHHWHVVLGYGFEEVVPGTGQTTPIKQTRIYRAANELDPVKFPLP
jgi:hypothetical protein